MESIESYLAQIEDILEDSKAVRFSSKVAVDKELIYEVIDEIRLNLPNEIKESRKLMDGKDKLLKEAEKKSKIMLENASKEAENTLKSAETKSNRLISDHEIYKAALEESEKILEDARKDAKNIRINAMDYADEILAKAEQAMKFTLDNMNKQHNSLDNYYNKILDTLYNNRQELRGK